MVLYILTVIWQPALSYQHCLDLFGQFFETTPATLGSCLPHVEAMLWTLLGDILNINYLFLS